jgi:hypothetical protein
VLQRSWWLAQVLIAAAMTAACSCDSEDSDEPPAQPECPPVPVLTARSTCWNELEGSALPDYTACAAAVDLPGIPPFAKQVEFLWKPPASERTPIQSLESGALDPARVSVLHGTVHDGRSDLFAPSGLAGVTVAVADALDYGTVLTEHGSVLDEPSDASASGECPSGASGRYFIAVNAGAPVRLRFSKPGFLPAERVVKALPGEYALVAPVELVPEPPVAATVRAGAESWQTALGATETDRWGSRQVRVFVPPDTTWTPASPTLDIGLKEYTVGPTGPARMPAELPPASAYTYAFEAIARDDHGDQVNPIFSQPVIVYVDNFLSLPVGWIVPSGSYDRAAGSWAQEQDGTSNLNGQIIEITGYEAGAAQLRGADLSLAERQVLHASYQPAAPLELWRVPIRHFSTFDFNWGWGPPPDSKPPEPEIDDDQDDEPCTTGGSTIECQTQVLGEEIAIAGTPFHLVYRSSRVRRATERPRACAFPSPAGRSPRAPPGSRSCTRRAARRRRGKWRSRPVALAISRSRSPPMASMPSAAE